MDETFVGEVAECLADGPPPALLDPEKAEVLDFGIDRVEHPPTVVVRYLHGEEEGVFRFELDDSVWSFGDAEEAAQMVWVDLVESLEAAD